MKGASQVPVGEERPSSYNTISLMDSYRPGDFGFSQASKIKQSNPQQDQGSPIGQSLDESFVPRLPQPAAEYGLVK